MFHFKKIKHTQIDLGIPYTHINIYLFIFLTKKIVFYKVFYNFCEAFNFFHYLLLNTLGVCVFFIDSIT